MTLPAHVIELDHRLEAEVKTAEAELEAASGALHLHRWHWTLDETNPDRVSIRQYAKDVGRHHSTISESVNGYAAWLAEQSGGPGPATRTLNDHIKRANAGEKTRQAAEAIAEAEGVSEGSVLTHRRHEVRDLIDAAEEAAAQPDGMTVEDEIRDRAQKIAQVKANKQRHKAGEKQKRDAVMLEIDTHLVMALTRLKKAAAAAAGSDVLTDEDRDILSALVQQCRSVIELVDAGLENPTQVDWDAELAALGGQ